MPRYCLVLFFPLPIPLSEKFPLLFISTLLCLPDVKTRLPRPRGRGLEHFPYQHDDGGHEHDQDGGGDERVVPDVVVALSQPRGRDDHLSLVDLHDLAIHGHVGRAGHRVVFELEPSRDVDDDADEGHDEGLDVAALDSPPHLSLGGIQVPIYCHGSRHVNRARHEGVCHGVEVGYRIGKILEERKKQIVYVVVKLNSLAFVASLPPLLSNHEIRVFCSKLQTF